LIESFQWTERVDLCNKGREGTEEERGEIGGIKVVEQDQL